MMRRNDDRFGFLFYICQHGCGPASRIAHEGIWTMKALIIAALMLVVPGPGLAREASVLAYEGEAIDPIGLVRIAEGRCSGVMVTPNMFLTAAHCVPVLAEGVEINAPRAGSGIRREVVDYRIPPYYVNSSIFSWDVAVVQISEPVDAGSVRVFPNAAPEAPEGYAGGWGQTDPTTGSEIPTAALFVGWEQAVPFSSVPRKDCGAFLGWGVMCSHFEQRSETCQGDSGGPMQLFDGRIIGLAVAGYPPCGRDLDYPGYSIDLTNPQFREWIGQAITDLDPLSFGRNIFQSCKISDVTVEGARHVTFSECIDGTDYIFRSDGLQVRYREGYYGAFWLRVDMNGRCTETAVDGFGKITSEKNC